MAACVQASGFHIPMDSDAFARFRVDGGGLRVNLGCGSKALPGYLGVDFGENTAADVKMEVMDWLRKQPAASVTEVYSRHMLEHLTHEVFAEFIHELDRVLMPSAKMLFIVPHYSNPYYYSDPTHRRPFGVHTFSYLCESSCLHRSVPAYARIRNWHLVRVRVGFVPYSRWRPLGIRIPMLSDLLNRLVNLGSLSVELFERYFCAVLSIYEVHYWIEKRASAVTSNSA